MTETTESRTRAGKCATRKKLVDLCKKGNTEEADSIVACYLPKPPKRMPCLTAFYMSTSLLDLKDSTGSPALGLLYVWSSLTSVYLNPFARLLSPTVDYTSLLSFRSR